MKETDVHTKATSLLQDFEDSSYSGSAAEWLSAAQHRVQLRASRSEQGTTHRTMIVVGVCVAALVNIGAIVNIVQNDSPERDERMARFETIEHELFINQQ